MIKKIIPFLILLTSCSAVKTLKTGSFLKKGTVNPEFTSCQIPFILKNNLVLVKVEINGKKYTLIFDTGSPLTTFSPEVVKELNTKKQSFTMQVGDANGNKYNYKPFIVNNIKIGSAVLTEMPCIEASSKALSDYLCMPVDGILGTPAMRQLIWGFNFKSNSLTISRTLNSQDKQQFTDTVGFTILSHNFTPGLNFTLNQINYGDYLSLDMGSTGGISFGKRFITKELPVFKYDTYAIGNNSIGFNGGTSKVDTTFYSYTNSFKTGTLDIDNSIISYNKNGKSMIGIGILKNYNYIIDWTSKTLFLSKHKDLTQTKVNKLGFKAAYENDYYSVKEIFANSLAEKANIQLGDKIIKVNGITCHHLADKDHCETNLVTTNLRDYNELIILRDSKEIIVTL